MPNRIFGKLQNRSYNLTKVCLTTQVERCRKSLGVVNPVEVDEREFNTSKAFSKGLTPFVIALDVLQKLSRSKKSL